MSRSENAAVRLASPADIPAVRAVATTTWHATYGEMLSAAAIDAFLARAYSDYALRQTLNSGGLWVVETAGSIAGYVRLAAQDDVGHLNAIYVLPERQGRGLGFRLWLCAAAWFEARSVSEVRLTVAEQNLPARDFYRRLGFEERGQRRTNLYGETLVERVCVLRLDRRGAAAR